MTLRSISVLATLVFILSSVGCVHHDYLRGFRYSPEPALVDVFRKGADNQKPPVSAMVSVVGVRTPDEDAHIPFCVEIRMRFENNGKVPVTFDPHTLQLVAGSLQTFDPPTSRPNEPLQIPPNQVHVITAYFPFPPGHNASSMGIDTLRLRWTIQIDNQTVPQTAYLSVLRQRFITRAIERHPRAV